MIYVIQNIPLGTGDAVKCALPYIDSNVVIINGDTPLLTHTLLQKFISNFNKNLLIAVTNTNNNKDNGRIEIKNNFVNIIEEKDCSSEQKKITLINCGIYMINKQTLSQIINKITNNNANNEYYLTDLTKFVETDVYVIDKNDQYQVYNINTIDQLNHAHKIINN